MRSLDDRYLIWFVVTTALAIALPIFCVPYWPALAISTLGGLAAAGVWWLVVMFIAHVHNTIYGDQDH